MGKRSVKVFCIQCEYFEERDDEEWYEKWKAECSAPQNVVERDTWYASGMRVHKSRPWEINRFNDCKWFKKAEEGYICD